MIKNVEFITPIVKLNLKLQFKVRFIGYGDAYILVSGTITVAEVSAGGGSNGIKVVFKSCAPFTTLISNINNSQIDIAKYIDVVMPMYNLIEYSINYLKTSRSLWECYTDKPVDFPGNSA